MANCAPSYSDQSFPLPGLQDNFDMTFFREVFMQFSEKKNAVFVWSVWARNWRLLLKNQLYLCGYLSFAASEIRIRRKWSTLTDSFVLLLWVCCPSYFIHQPGCEALILYLGLVLCPVDYGICS